ncbi:MAG: hypothetical protein DRJ61_14690, partial [Acidobacteria bacterium]
MGELSAISSQLSALQRRLWSTVLVVLIVMVGSPLLAQEAPVVAVEIQAGDWAPNRDIEGILGLEIGKPIDRRHVRQGIQVLMAAGEFSWIRCRARSGADGLSVTVELDVHPRLAVLDIDVPSALWEFRVKRWLDIEIGDPVNPGRFEVAARRIRRRIERRGYPDVTVDPYLSLDRGGHKVIATLEVRPGSRAMLAGLKIEGLSEGLDQETLMPDIKVGRKLTETAVDDLREKIERRIRLAGYWEAKVVGVERTGPAGASV